MTKHVGFLRAVNVGKRRVGMGRLVDTCEELGYREVRTYANSGNVLFDTTGFRVAIEQAMQLALERTFGIEVTTFVRSPGEVRKALHADPFNVGNGDTYFITFLKTPPSAVKAKALEALSNDFDTLIVIGREVHWRMRGKSTETTVTSENWNLVGEHRSTSRNISMLRKLATKPTGREPHAGYGAPRMRRDVLSRERGVAVVMRRRAGPGTMRLASEEVAEGCPL